MITTRAKDIKKQKKNMRNSCMVVKFMLATTKLQKKV